MDLNEISRNSVLFIMAIYAHTMQSKLSVPIFGEDYSLFDVSYHMFAGNYCVNEQPNPIARNH